MFTWVWYLCNMHTAKAQLSPPRLFSAFDALTQKVESKIKANSGGFIMYSLEAFHRYITILVYWCGWVPLKLNDS